MLDYILVIWHLQYDSGYNYKEEKKKNNEKLSSYKQNLV